MDDMSPFSYHNKYSDLRDGLLSQEAFSLMDGTVAGGLSARLGNYYYCILLMDLLDSLLACHVLRSLRNCMRLGTASVRKQKG